MKRTFKSFALGIWVSVLGLLCGLAMNLTFLKPRLIQGAQRYYAGRVLTVKHENKMLEQKIKNQKKQNKKLQNEVDKLERKKQQKDKEKSKSFKNDRSSNNDKFVVRVG